MSAKNLSFLYFLWAVCLFKVQLAACQNDKVLDSSLHYYELFTNPKKSTDLTTAFGYYQNQLEQNLRKKDTTAAILNLRYIASIQNDLGLFYDSEKTVVQALILIDHQKIEKNSSAKTGLYNQLGMIHRALFNFDKAVEDYNEALKASASSEDSISVLNNIAYTYAKQGKHELAQVVFEKAYLSSVKNGFKDLEARALNNLGAERGKQNNPMGIINMQEALKIRQSLNNGKGLYSSYKHLTEYYLSKNIRDSASFYAEKAYSSAKLLNSMSYMEDALSNLLNLKKDTLVMQYKAIKDSILKTKQLQENKFAEMQYNYSEFRLEAQKSKLIASEQRANSQRYKFVIVSIAIVAFFIIVILHIKHKRENLLKIYETETRISKKVHDEVANDIFKVMMKVQTAKTADIPILEELDHIYIKTRDISKENGDIIHADFKNQLEELLRSYQNPEVNVITKNLKDINWSQLSNDKKTMLYRVFQELMTNMKKHSNASLVVFTFERKKKKLYIVYKDNGIGTNLKKGNGCHNMESRMASIKGTIHCESQIGSGFKATLIV